MLAFWLSAWLAAQPSAGTKSAEQRPVEMRSSGGLEVDLKRSVGIAKGDVVIQRDDVIVCCDEAEAHYTGQHIDRVECRGRVVVVRADGTRAVADVAVFDATKEVVSLSGKARVRSESADVEGQLIVYDIRADQLSVKGKKSRFRFQPPASEGLALPRTCPPN